jgi:hypothetical protein
MFDPGGFIMHSQRQIILMTMLVRLENQGTAEIDYYEDNSELPTSKKTIKWR